MELFWLHMVSVKVMSVPFKMSILVKVMCISVRNSKREKIRNMCSSFLAEEILSNLGVPICSVEHINFSRQGMTVEHILLSIVSLAAFVLCIVFFLLFIVLSCVCLYMHYIYIYIYIVR